VGWLMFSPHFFNEAIMNKYYLTLNSQQEPRLSIDNRSAYHQAGRAAAIYLGNKLKQLPAVHFQITITEQDNDGQQFARTHDNYAAKVEGGRLIQNLPFSFASLAEDFSWFQQEQFRCAVEADIINILAGSLAEAKYTALEDDEIFTANLINIAALHFYGGNSDLELISQYMECFMADKAEREKKLDELYLAAFNFVNKRSNWRAITALADYIRGEQKTTISCEEVISLLESRLAA
jgi:hypothetical protein